jgi:hypothetical protein
MKSISRAKEIHSVTTPPADVVPAVTAAVAPTAPVVMGITAGIDWHMIVYRHVVLTNRAIGEYLESKGKKQYVWFEDLGRLDNIAINGKVRFRAWKDEYWCEEGGKDYVSPVLDNPTWLQLCELANDAIARTKDYRHIFFEGVRKLRTLNGIQSYYFHLGS